MTGLAAVTVVAAELGARTLGAGEPFLAVCVAGARLAQHELVGRVVAAEPAGPEVARLARQRVARGVGDWIALDGSADLDASASRRRRVDGVALDGARIGAAAVRPPSVAVATASRGRGGRARGRGAPQTGPIARARPTHRGADNEDGKPADVSHQEPFAWPARNGPVLRRRAHETKDAYPSSVRTGAEWRSAACRVRPLPTLRGSRVCPVCHHPVASDLCFVIGATELSPVDRTVVGPLDREMSTSGTGKGENRCDTFS